MVAGVEKRSRALLVEISVTRAPGSRWVIGQWSAPVSQSSARDEREEEVLEPPRAFPDQRPADLTTDLTSSLTPGS